MEVDHLRKTGQGCVIQEEKRDELSNHDEDHCKEEVVLKDEKLELAKAEMGEVREENQRLRLYLDQIMRDYQILQKKFQDTMKNRAATNSINHQEMEEPDQLVSLSLGRTLSSDLKKDIDRRSKTPTTTHEEDNLKEGLALGLDCKFEVSSTTQAESSVNLSPENSLEEAKEEAGDQTWPPQKNLKTKRSGDDDHEVAPQTPAKKTRVSVRVRCDTPTMNDGCQWRKYGQKIAKGNPCPRAYYRCTVSPSCPVRKQVQRCAQDMSILITTYEGTHNHPLPISATAMASTTSAAASMLSSGSSTSVSNPNPLAAGTNSELHGMNFYLSENSKLKPFYLPYSSVSPSPSCPTITLDLTSNTVSSSSPFNRSSMPTNFPPRFSTTNLNFKPLESSALPISWSNGVLAGYSGAQAQPYDCKNQIGSLNFGIRQPQENLYQSYMQKNMANAITATPIQQSLQPDTIEAATKAITSDPNFQSALQAALTSIIGGGDKIDQNRNNLSDLFPLFSSFPSTSNANK